MVCFKNLQQTHNIQILNGSPQVLCAARDLRNKYQTNRNIKTWAAWYILKSITTTGVIQNWNNQKENILNLLQCSENNFRTRLTEMKAIGLLMVNKKTKSIYLKSYEKAATILGIEFTGTTTIEYNPTKHQGTLPFQHFIRGEEINSNQQTQLNALHFKLAKNPSIKQKIITACIAFGACGLTMQNDAKFFQAAMLQAQKVSFADGTDHWQDVNVLRADVDRSCKTIAKHHTYKSQQSVSYMKQAMEKAGVLQIKKSITESKARTRHYYIDKEGIQHEAYKWIEDKKVTAIRHCDQLTTTYTTIAKKKQNEKAA